MGSVCGRVGRVGGVEGDAMRCTLLCVLGAVEDGFCSLEALEVQVVMRCVPFCMLEAVEVPETLCMLFCMLEAVEGGLCLWTRWRCRR